MVVQNHYLRGSKMVVPITPSDTGSEHTYLLEYCAAATKTGREGSVAPWKGPRESSIDLYRLCKEG